MKVSTKVLSTELVRCYAETAIMGTVVVGQGHHEFEAQNKAAKFLDANFPDTPIEWVGGYHGGDTSNKTGNVLGHYNDKRN